MHGEELLANVLAETLEGFGYVAVTCAEFQSGSVTLDDRGHGFCDGRASHGTSNANESSNRLASLEIVGQSFLNVGSAFAVSHQNVFAGIILELVPQIFGNASAVRG